MRRPSPDLLARSLLALGLWSSLSHHPAFAAPAEDRSLFQAATVKRCLQGQRQDPANAQRTDTALNAYCGCYAAEMARTVPSDILNTSASAATPQQARTLGQLADEAGKACAVHLADEPSRP